MTSVITDLDHLFLSRAVDLSREKMLLGHGGPFGAIIVKEGVVIAEGWNEVTSTNDPTAHAEIVAIRRACRALRTFDLSGSTIYASCEPCPMCLSAIYWARCARIVFSNTREDAARIGFSDQDIYEEIPRPHHQRALPIARLPLDAAREVFDIWARKTDRVAY